MKTDQRGWFRRVLPGMFIGTCFGVSCFGTGLCIGTLDFASAVHPVMEDLPIHPGADQLFEVITTHMHEKVTFGITLAVVGSIAMVLITVIDQLVNRRASKIEIDLCLQSASSAESA